MLFKTTLCRRTHAFCNGCSLFGQKITVESSGSEIPKSIFRLKLKAADLHPQPSGFLRKAAQALGAEREEAACRELQRMLLQQTGHDSAI